MHVQTTQSAVRSRIYLGASADPAVNLAAEELIFGGIQAGDVHLVLYVDGPSVVIGKHQNPWRECDIAALRNHSVPLYRRISGGGTVFHDPGNLNFSFLLDRDLFDKMNNLGLIARALGRVGIRAEVTARGDILVDGRKVSGNALAIKRGRVLHHGTLLVDADLARLRQVIRRQPPAATNGGAASAASAAVSADSRSESWASTIVTHAVSSEPAKVANLSDFVKGLSVQRVGQAIREQFAEEWGATETEDLLESADARQLSALSERYRSWQWNFGATPKFEAVFGFGPDSHRVTLRVREATIRDVECDACAEAAHSASCSARKFLEGSRFDSDAIAERCRTGLSSTSPANGEMCGVRLFEVLAGYAKLKEF